MPGTSLTIKSSAGHDFLINNTLDDINDVLKQLKELHCNNCGTVDYKGKTVDVCTHVICRQCSSESPELLKNLKDRCSSCFDGITKNKLQAFKEDTIDFLRNLPVCCPKPRCPAQDLLKSIDYHMEIDHIRPQYWV